MLEKLLDKKGITKYRLAKETGLGQGTIHEIVTGKRKNIELNTASKLAEILEVSIDYIYQCIKEGEENGR